MFCQECGTENSDESKFCVKCGTKIGFVQTPPTPAPPPVISQSSATEEASVRTPPPAMKPSSGGRKRNRVIAIAMVFAVAAVAVIAVSSIYVNHRMAMLSHGKAKQPTCPPELLQKYKAIIGGSGSAKQVADRVQSAIQTDIRAEINRAQSAGGTYPNDPWGVEAVRLEACAMAATEAGKQELSGEFDRRATAKFNEMATHSK